VTKKRPERPLWKCQRAHIGKLYCTLSLRAQVVDGIDDSTERSRGIGFDRAAAYPHKLRGVDRERSVFAGRKVRDEVVALKHRSTNVRLKTIIRGALVKNSVHACPFSDPYRQLLCDRVRLLERRVTPVATDVIPALSFSVLLVDDDTTQQVRPYLLPRLLWLKY